MYYGKEVSFKISNGEKNTKNSTNTNDNNTITFYIPELITASLSNLNNGKIKVGSHVTWNADPKNENGVVLAVEYKTSSQKIQSIAENYTQRIMKGITLNDNGSYTITASDLAEFPNNATLSFYIGRTGYQINTGNAGENDISIGAYTALRADFDIQK